ncbi:Ig-like domain-containing protein [Bifidobacterium sp. ESL0775]|uniref:Ig-like domain-containing protein n=1 Tax=Bifidobacterium sp. ESL0775 TaxID=2983230 RepID=UPI0023F72537|nr:Ig-like domain-containing protein [Bifidobacterium sp. ESL0775]WEV68718.1 Ig-like domain-containing protein [Bifidobacterium sp. ESL0775]
MAADAKGNDLTAVDVPVTGQIAIAPYSAANVLTSQMGGGKTVTWPQPNPYLWLGLIKKDGGFSEGQEKGDAIEFYQQGYQLNASPDMTLKVGLAEFNKVVRKFITGKDPDENGMIPVSTYTPDTKWLLFTEEVFKNGVIRRRNGVIQIDTTEVDQSERGTAQGRDVTLKWQTDSLIGDGATTKFNEWVIDTKNSVPATGVSVTPATLDLTVGETGSLTATVTNDDASDKTVTWASLDTSVATVDSAGTVTAKATGTAAITATTNSGGKTASCEVTVTA